MRNSLYQSNCFKRLFGFLFSFCFFLFFFLDSTYHSQLSILMSLSPIQTEMCCSEMQKFLQKCQKQIHAMKSSTQLTSIVPTMRESNIFLKNIPMAKKAGFLSILCTNQCRSIMFLIAKKLQRNCKMSQQKCRNYSFSKNLKDSHFHK